MKVILQRDIPKLGKGGDIVNVADGYARNYLFPRAFAVAATGGAMKEYNARLTREKEKGSRMLQSAQSDAEKLAGLTVRLVGKVGSGTKLYGSITAQDVADAITKERGVTVDKRRVGLADPIKTLGSYAIPVRLHSDVSVSVQVEVLTEEELERRKSQPVVAATAPGPVVAAPAEAEPMAVAEAAAVPEAVMEPETVIEMETAEVAKMPAEPETAAEPEPPIEAEAASEETAEAEAESA